MQDALTVNEFKKIPAVQKKITYFKYSHLPEHLQERSKIFYDTAMKMVEENPLDVAEGIISLNHLLQAKDAYVRSFIN